MTANFLILSIDSFAQQQATIHFIIRVAAAFASLGTMAIILFLARNGDRFFGAGPLASGESHSSRRYLRFCSFAVLVHLALIFALVALMVH